MENKVKEIVKKEEAQNVLLLMGILLFIVIGFTSNHYLSIVAFILFCSGGLFLPNKLLIYDLFFLMPFASIFKYSADSLSLFTLCEIYLIVLFLLRGEKFSFPLLLSMATYLGYLLLGTLISDQWAITETIKQIMNIALLFLMVRIVLKDFKEVSFYFFAGVLGASILALFADHIPDFYEFIPKVGYSAEIENRFTSLNGDPNYYAINVILSLWTLIVLYKSEELTNIMFWILFLSLSFFGLQTYSKSFLLMYVIELLALFIHVLKRRKIFDLIVFGAIGVVFIILCFQKNNVISLTLERLFSANDLDSLTTNRSGLWKDYIDCIFSSFKILFLGVGIGSDYLESGGPHNLYIELVYYLGWIGCLILFYNFFLCFHLERTRQKKRLTNYIGIFILLLMYFFLQMLFAYDWIFQMLLAYLMLISGSKKNQKEV